MTVRFLLPMTAMGFPTSAGLVACSTEAKKASMSMCRIVRGPGIRVIRRGAMKVFVGGIRAMLV